MSQRSWFFVHEDQASGPLSDLHIRTLLASGALTPTTLVWTDGVTDWIKASDIPELWSHDPVAPPIPAVAIPDQGTDVHEGALAFVAGPLETLGRSLLFLGGLVLVIPGPRAAASYYRWLVSRLRVPGRPDLTFTGQPGDIWQVFVGLSLVGYASGVDRLWPDYWWVQIALFPIQIYLWWLALRWVASHLASEGTPLPIKFEGPFLTFLGWYVAYYLSILTIIGWAWVANAWTRWNCRQITGSRRRLEYHATGLEVLWRTIVTVLGCLLVIPIPWVVNWYLRWYVSQFRLTGRAAAP